MQSIEPQITKTGVTIWITKSFSWKFVEICRKYRVRWDPIQQKRYIKFNNAALPLSAERIVENYKEVFNFFEKHVVDIFILTMNAIIKIKNVLPPILTEKVDLSEYPELFEHQKTGIQFIEDKSGLCIIGDEQGLGKTKTVCVWLIKSQFERVLIITPLTASFIWKLELITLGIPDNYITIIEKNYIDNRFTIINYDKLHKFKDEIIKNKIDCVIIDEAHKLNNRNTKRFKVVEKITKKIPRVICVTGTPISNRPLEIFPLLRIIKATLGKNINDFADRYCDRKLVSHGTGQHYDISGSSNLDELGNKLKNHMIRRLKKDCLDLPEKTHNIYKLNLQENDIDIYGKLKNDVIEYIKIHGKIKKNNDLILAKLSLLRQFCSEKKMQHTDDFIKDSLAANEKILIFSYFNSSIRALHEKYKDSSVLITGDITKKDERERLQHLFQTDPNIKIFFGNIKAAGVALTLIAGSKVVFNDLSWTPTDHSQAEDRIHRIGLDHDVRIIYLLFRETIEEDIFDLLNRKRTMIDKIMSESELHFNEESVIKELLNKYKNLAQ